MKHSSAQVSTKDDDILLSYMQTYFLMSDDEKCETETLDSDKYRQG